jgi:hypothetical protein
LLLFCLLLVLTLLAIRAAPEGKRLRADISLTEGRYKGTVVSKKSLGFVSESSEEMDSDIAAGSSDDDEEISGSDIAEAESSGSDASQSDSGSDLDSDSESQSSHDDNAAFVSKADEVMRKELEAIQREQKYTSHCLLRHCLAHAACRQVLQSLTVDTGAEMRKGVAARNQRSLFDASLEIRIKLQRSLLLANRLPRVRLVSSSLVPLLPCISPRNRSQFTSLPLFEARTPAVSDALQAAAAEAVDAVASLLELRAVRLPGLCACGAGLL